MSKISDTEKVDNAEQLSDKSYSLSMLLTLIRVPCLDKRSVLGLYREDSYDCKGT